jgi:hypothetical protein
MSLFISFLVEWKKICGNQARDISGSCIGSSFPQTEKNDAHLDQKKRILFRGFEEFLRDIANELIQIIVSCILRKAWPVIPDPLEEVQNRGLKGVKPASAPCRATRRKSETRLTL